MRRLAAPRSPLRGAPRWLRASRPPCPAYQGRRTECRPHAPIRGRRRSPLRGAPRWLRASRPPCPAYQDRRTECRPHAPTRGRRRSPLRGGPRWLRASLPRPTDRAPSGGSERSERGGRFISAPSRPIEPDHRMSFGACASARPSTRGRTRPRTSRAAAVAPQLLEFARPRAAKRRASRQAGGRPRVALCAPIAFRSRISARHRIGQRQVLHVHHRIGEARRDQHVADVVHVDEAVHVRVPVDAARYALRAAPSACRARRCVNMKSPPGSSTRRISANARGRSFTHCSARLDHTSSTLRRRAAGARGRRNARRVPAKRAGSSRRAASGRTATRSRARLEHRRRDVERDDARARIARARARRSHCRCRIPASRMRVGASLT